MDRPRALLRYTGVAYIETPGCVWASVTYAPSSFTNAKVIQRKIRVQVVDCRSGAPKAQVPVEQVLIADAGETFDEKKHAAVRFLGEPGWDFAENYIVPVGASGSPLDATGFSRDSYRGLQRVLNALGYDCGTPSARFGKQGWGALERYQLDWCDENGEARPAKFKQEVSTLWLRRILADYNERFHRAVQLHLTGLGYPCEEDDGKWEKASQEALGRWQKLEFGTGDPFTLFNTTRNLAARKALAGKLRDARKRFFTDDRGVLHVPVPVEKVKNGFRLRITFAHFPLLLEEPNFRTGPNAQPTGASVEWVATQDAVWSGSTRTQADRWGWRLRPGGDTRERDALPEFRFALELDVPAADATTLTWRELSAEARRKARFSPFFPSPDGQQAEYVAFALEWCQPVWDGIEDPSARHTTNADAYVEPGTGERGRSMHIVTRASDLGGSDDFGGKGYGKIERMPLGSTRWRGDDGHSGFDIHAVVGADLFAMHGGKIRRYDGGDGGNVCEVSWTGTGRTSVAYLHLSEYVAPSKAVVKAGERIGRAGRTGNLGENSANPGHVHLNVGANGYTSALRDTPDAANRVVVPTNDTALLFPCRCHIPNAAVSMADCRFEDDDFTSTCWAAAGLCCPYMDGAGRNARRLQAQLRYLFLQNGAPYLLPGTTVHSGIDGSLGAVPTPATPAAGISRSRRAIRAFRIANGLVPADSAPQVGCGDLTDGEWDLLDGLAPIVAPETAP